MYLIIMGVFRIIFASILYKGDKYYSENNSLLVTGPPSRHEHKQKPQITLSGNKEWTWMLQ